MHVSITFIELALHSYGDSESDCTAYVQLLDGVGVEAPQLKKYCGYNIPPPTAGHSNALTVQLVMSYNMPSTGKFLLQWAAVNETQAAALNPTQQTPTRSSTFNEEITLNRSTTYRITSPGYPFGNNFAYQEESIIKMY